MNTMPLEADTRILIDKSLENLGWKFTGKDKNVFFEQPKTEEERKKLQGKRPDYVLYSKEDDQHPLIVIEAKKKGERIDSALKQGIHYAKQLEAPIVYATDGLFCKTYHTKFDKTPILNGEEVDEFLREVLALKYLNTWEVNTVSPKVQYDRKELIKIFDEANNILRGDGLRAGIERFGEFANILFLKLISESEDIKKLSGIQSDFDDMCHWDYIKNLKASSRIEHINKIVYEKLNALYKTEIFTPLSIRDASILKEIIDKLDPLTLTDVDSDVKGDAFEYFLKESTATKNDLGEYFTPRHIVKAMVKLVNPQIGEKVYDPFCGTGGFLIESFRHIWNTMPRNETTKKVLREKTIYGNEITNTARITKMNMILAGDGHSNIHMKDSLANPINGEYDVVLANMPYSQKTKYGNLYDLPNTNGDSICVQHCMKAINKTSDNGRIAIVVPEGFLFRKDLAKTRELILKNCNLQSIISLPQGVFLPYTGVKTNIIYATKVNQKLSSNEKRKDYWYFEVKSDGYTLDNHRRKLDSSSDLDTYQEYRKLDQEQSEEMFNVGFEIIPLEKVKKNSYILVGSRYREKELVRSIWEMIEVDKLFSSIKNGRNVKQTDNIGKYRVSRIETISNGYFDILRTKWTNDDVREEDFLKNGDILLSHINSFEHLGKSALFSENNRKVIHGTNLIKFSPDTSLINPIYASYVFKSDYFIDSAKQFAQRAVNQASIKVSDLKKIKIPVPPLDIQQQIAHELESYQQIIDGAKAIVDNYSPKIQINIRWKEYMLKEIIEGAKGGFACGKNSKDSTQLIHIRPMNITTKGELTLVGSKFVDSNLMISKEQYMLKQNDILFNNTNSKELVGKTCIVEYDIIAVYSNHITRIRVNNDIVIPKFLSIYLHNMWQSGYFEEKCHKWIGQAGVGLEELLSTPVFMPSIEEQHQIITQIEAEQTLIEPSKQLAEIFNRKIQSRVNDLFKDN